MSDQNREIIEAIQRLAGTWGKDYMNVIVARVVSVDEDTLTCSVDPINDSSTVTIDNVLLSAEANDGLIQYPSNDSIVLVAYGVKQQPFILMFSDIYKCRITIGNCDFYIDKDGIKLHGDNYGGLVKVDDLVDKINTLENTINQIAFWALTVTPPLTINPIVPTTAAEISNSKVQHGNL